LKLQTSLNKTKLLINKKLLTLLPPASAYPAAIHEAMHYSINGGKRIRPILCLLSCSACGGDIKDALNAACAIEIIHAYSLIHDDLPSMDNASTRRGRPSCHIKFGEAVAVLAGDAFLTLGFNVISGATASDKKNAKIAKELSHAIGTFGMIGGQVADIQQQTAKRKGQRQLCGLPRQEYINAHKTGALIAASCKIGAIIAGASCKQEEAILKYGEYIGFAFQLVDDILDSEGLARILGKREAYDRAAALTTQAKENIKILKKRKELEDIADCILKRKF